MPFATQIQDGGTGQKATVAPGGELRVISRPDGSHNATLSIDDIPVEIVEGQRTDFIMTGLVLTGNKNISTSVDAIVTIFEATADDLTTNLMNLLVIPVARSGQISLLGIHLHVQAGRFIMGETSDDDVLVTIFGHYL